MWLKSVSPVSSFPLLHNVTQLRFGAPKKDQLINDSDKNGQAHKKALQQSYDKSRIFWPWKHTQM